MTDDELAAIEQRLREICLALPGTTERLSHGAPGFFAGGQYLAIRMRGHHRNEFPHLWFAAARGVQAELVDGEPDRCFVPPYVGGRGWVGLRLDWDELAAICARRPPERHPSPCCRPRARRRRAPQDPPPS